VEHAAHDGPGIVLSAIGAKCGKCFYADGGWTAIKNTIAIIPSQSSVHGLFLFYALNQPEQWPKRGGSQPFIGLADTRELELDLPPLNEQKRIVEKLESLQARSRRAKAALDEVPALLEKLRQSILAAAFRGDLTKEWREKNPNVEPASALLARIRVERRMKWEEAELAKMTAKGKKPTDDKWKAKYKEPEPVDTTDLPELPEGWCWASLDELCFLAGGVTKGQKRAPSATVIQAKYLRVANVQRGFLNLSSVASIDATPSEIEELRLLPGDILLNEGGDADKLGRGWVWEGQIADCIHQNHVFRARLISQSISPYYVSHYANEKGQAFFLEQGKQTTNLASVSISRVKRLPIPLPAETESQALLALVSARLVQIDTLRSSTRARADWIADLDRSLLAKAFRGELVPQDPNDEPADVLLARVKAGAGDVAPKGRGRPARTAVAPETVDAGEPSAPKKRGRPKKG
jgi:type I restriction enzyme S subunit